MYNMAGGGIVAFQGGGSTFDEFIPQEVSKEPLVDLVEIDVPDELTGKVGLAQVYGIKEGRYGRTKDEILKSFGVRPTTPAARPAAVTSAAVPSAVPAAPAAPAREAGIAAIPTKESILDRRGRMLEQRGVTDTTEADLAELEKNRGRLAEDKFDALRMSLIRAGLGMAAGTSPYALSNIAKGGIEGFDTYEQSIKQIKAEEKEYGKLARDLRKEANAVKRSDVDKALDLESKAEMMDIERDKLKYTRQSALKPSTFQEQLNALTGGSKDPKVIQEATRIIIGASKTGDITDEDIYKGWAGLEDYEKKRLQKEGIYNFEDYKKRERAKGTGAVPGVKFLGVR